MMKCVCFSLIAVSGLLFIAGCQTVTPQQDEPRIVDKSQSMVFLDPILQPEVLLFPEYLLMEGFEIQQHGRIPESRLIGAGMTSRAGIKTVFKELNSVLVANGWTASKMELHQKSFRILAENKGEQLEIRVVQGGGKSHLFLLYQPKEENSG